MFGYVRPIREELKCKEFDLYRATYCGLCRELRRRYGLIAPMFLNFDFTFLALLLWQPEEHFTMCRGRCHANPWVKKQMCTSSSALETAADESIILAYWKLRDAAVDDGIWGGLAPRSLAALLAPAYHRAAAERPQFDGTTRGCLQELSALEGANSASLDRTADTFARILQAAAPATGEERQDRALKQLLYHLGRWIYLMDARDDLERDRQAGCYNPVAARFGAQGDDCALRLTLDHSLNLARSAACMADFGFRTPIVENVLYLGLPMVQQAVFDGSWAQVKKQKIWRQEA